MKEKSRSELKLYFESGDTPSSGEFAELIDSFVNKADDDISVRDGKVGIGIKRALNKLDVSEGMAVGRNFAGEIIAPENGLLVEGKLSIGTPKASEQLTVNGAISLHEFNGSPTAEPGFGKLYTKVSSYYHLRFDGDTNYIDLTAHLSKLKMLSNGTLSFWFKPIDSTVRRQSILFAGNTTHCMHLSLGPSSDNEGECLHLALSDPSAAGGGHLMYFVRLGEEYFTELRWYHLLITIGDRSHQVYVDGTEQIPDYENNAQTTGHFLDHVDDGEDAGFYVGKMGGNTPYPLKGYLDEFVIFNRHVSQKEAKTIFESGRKTDISTKFGNSLAAYWRMEDNHDLPVIGDRSGNDYHGSWVGTINNKTLVRTDEQNLFFKCSNGKEIALSGSASESNESLWGQKGENIYFNAGNVGIGTSDPNAALTVNGHFIRKVRMATGLGPIDSTDNGRIISRVLSFTKLYNETAIRIIYCDNFRLYGSGGHSGRWEIRIDGKPPPGGAIFQDKYNNAAGLATNFHEPSIIMGYASGINIGNHEIQVWVSTPIPGHSSSDLYTGWANSRWTIEAQEVWIQE